MNRQIFLTIIFSILIMKGGYGQVNNAFGSLPPFTKWYQNPLGVSPIALHTGNGIIIPALAAATVLICTKTKMGGKPRISMFDDFIYSKGYYGSFSNLYHHDIGVNYMLRKYMSVGIEFTQVYIHDNINQVWGLGLRPFFRFYPVANEKFKLFFSSGAGLIYFFKNFPQPSGFFGDLREGTKLNGCPKYGIGAEMKLNSKISLTAGLWHLHVSNGDNPSFERNPGHDSNGFSAGIRYTLHPSAK